MGMIQQARTVVVVVGRSTLIFAFATGGLPVTIDERLKRSNRCSVIPGLVR
jgi:hypothetical protein